MLSKEQYFDSIKCPVCKGIENIKLYSISHNRSKVLEILQLGEVNREVDLVICRNCNHIYMTPVIHHDLMNKYYSILNSEFYNATSSQPQNHNYKEYQAYAKQIKSLKKNGRVLEIGCGNGFLLKTLEDAGYDCYGVEPSPLAFDYAKNKLGLKVENSFLADSSFYPQKFDIVILIDVVEHIVDMNVFMKEVTTVLNDGAVIFIGTGNIDSLNARLAGPDWGYFLSWEHVSFFNKKSMHYLLTKNNFKNICITETSLQHKPVQNTWEFIKNLFKKILNPFVKKKYYHGICYDHMIAIAAYEKH